MNLLYKITKLEEYAAVKYWLLLLRSVRPPVIKHSWIHTTLRLDDKTSSRHKDFQQSQEFRFHFSLQTFHFPTTSVQAPEISDNMKQTEQMGDSQIAGFS